MQSFVAQPPCVAPARSSAVSMSLLQQPMDRRAAVSGAGLALFAMGQRANAATLGKDKAELALEQDAEAKDNAAIIKAGNKELADEIAEQKAEDKVLAAMRSGADKDTIKKLQAEAKALKVQEEADEKVKLALEKKVSADAKLVANTKAQVTKDVSDELAGGSKAILEAEEQKISAVLASEGQADTFSFVSKFFKQ